VLQLEWIILISLHQVYSNFKNFKLISFLAEQFDVYGMYFFIIKSMDLCLDIKLELYNKEMTIKNILFS